MELRVSPPQLEVDDGLGRSALHQALEDGRPLGYAFGGVVHGFEDFVGFDGVVP